MVKLVVLINTNESKKPYGPASVLFLFYYVNVISFRGTKQTTSENVLTVSSNFLRSAGFGRLSVESLRKQAF